MKTGMFPEGRVEIRVKTTIVISGVPRWWSENTRAIPHTMDEAQGAAYLFFWGMDAALNSVGDASRAATEGMREVEASDGGRG
jgi:hypothetical protein